MQTWGYAMEGEPTLGSWKEAELALQCRSEAQLA